MDDRFYRRSVKPHFSGGYQLHADALAQPVPPSYPRYWFCSHDDGAFHVTPDEALHCAQYAEFLRQMT
jgi:hypothetical protein